MASTNGKFHRGSSPRPEREDILEIVYRYSSCRVNDDFDQEKEMQVLDIIQKSFSNPELFDWVHRVDELIEWQLEQGKVPEEKVIQEILAIQKLVIDLNLHPCEPLKFSEFSEIVKNFCRHIFDIKQYFSESDYIIFNPQKFLRNLIAKSESLTVYAIGWLPGQSTDIHHHGYDLDAILVLEGRLTHWLWEPAVDPAAATPVPQYFTAGDIITIDRHQCHKIANTTSINLKTIHIRLRDATVDNFQDEGVGFRDDRWFRDDHWNRPLSEESHKKEKIKGGCLVMLKDMSEYRLNTLSRT